MKIDEQTQVNFDGDWCPTQKDEQVEEVKEFNEPINDQIPFIDKKPDSERKLLETMKRNLQYEELIDLEIKRRQRDKFGDQFDSCSTTTEDIQQQQQQQQLKPIIEESSDSDRRILETLKREIQYEQYIENEIQRKKKIRDEAITRAANEKEEASQKHFEEEAKQREEEAKQREKEEAKQREKEEAKQREKEEAKQREKEEEVEFRQKEKEETEILKRRQKEMEWKQIMEKKWRDERDAQLSERRLREQLEEEQRRIIESEKQQELNALEQKLRREEQTYEIEQQRLEQIQQREERERIRVEKNQQLENERLQEIEKRKAELLEQKLRAELEAQKSEQQRREEREKFEAQIQEQNRRAELALQERVEKLREERRQHDEWLRAEAERSAMEANERERLRIAEQERLIALKRDEKQRDADEREQKRREQEERHENLLLQQKAHDENYRKEIEIRIENERREREEQIRKLKEAKEKNECSILASNLVTEAFEAINPGIISANKDRYEKYQEQTNETTTTTTKFSNRPIVEGAKRISVEDNLGDFVSVKPAIDSDVCYISGSGTTFGNTVTLNPSIGGSTTISTSTAELKLRPTIQTRTTFQPIPLPVSPRMEYNSTDYRCNINKRQNYSQHRTLSPPQATNRTMKIVSETSSISSGSPFCGSTTATTIREVREREKKQMSDLNDRLASYIEKVRFLEAQNRKLGADLNFLRSRWGKDTTNVKDMYEIELQEAYKLIEKDNLERIDVEKEIFKLQEEIRILRSKYDEAIVARCQDKDLIEELLIKLSALEGEIDLLKRRICLLEENIKAIKCNNNCLLDKLQCVRAKLEEETFKRIDYHNQATTLMEEIDFLKRSHESQIYDLQAIVSRDTTCENREYFKNELAAAIRDIRAEYDQICNVHRVDMESWYKLKVQEIQTQSVRQNMEQCYSKEEVKRLRTQLIDLRGKLGDLEGRNSLLEKQAEQLSYQLEDDQCSYESALNERECQIRTVRDRIDVMIVELNSLLDTKQTLDAEIAIYRKMMEGEEDRAGLRDGWDTCQLGIIHNKFVNEKETARIIQSEKASRTSLQRSAKGNVSIWKADPAGQFIILENTHRSREENIGCWKLQRKIDCKDEIVYTFPRDFVLSPAKTVKIWARNQGIHNPPDQLVFDGEDTFGCGNNVQTILYNTHGEERATLIQRTSQPPVVLAPTSTVI